MIPADHERRLRLYNEQAGVMLCSRFAAAMFGQVSGVQLSWEEGGTVEAEVKGPDEEAVRAFVLTFRMFFKDGDGISFREMAAIYDSASVPGNLHDDYRWAREAINQVLDSPTMFNVNGERVTHKRLLDVFLYGGGLAHANPDKRAVYQLWSSQPVLFALMRNEFAVTMAEFFNHVRFVSELNRELLGSDDNERNDPPDI